MSFYFTTTKRYVDMCIKNKSYEKPNKKDTGIKRVGDNGG